MQINDEPAQRLTMSLEALSARIARLAIGLNIHLDDERAVQALMEKSQLPVIEIERRAPATGDTAHHASPSLDRRQAHLREQLRGLLAMRYHLEATMVADNGLPLTREIIAQAEEHLVQRGFKPGVDGLALDDFFNAP